MARRVLVKDSERHSEVEYVPGFIPPMECAALLAALRARRPEFEGGRKLTTEGWSDVPRLVLAFGDRAFTFVDMEKCAPWFDRLRALRDLLARQAGHPFNYALVNWYRDGADYAGWHADKAQFHERGTSIAIVSLGGGRRFAVRDAGDHRVSGEVCAEPGSVIWMRGETQAHYEHAVPADPPVRGDRLSVTFRCLRLDMADDRAPMDESGA